MASNNDCGVREYDMEKFQLLNHFRFSWPVNVILLSIWHEIVDFLYLFFLINFNHIISFHMSD